MQSLLDIKETLSSLGISTTTPNLEGRDRYLELSRRLEQHKSNVNKQDKIIVSSPVSIIEGLTMTEIKSKLSIYGEV
jgi:hypothetical protein